MDREGQAAWNSSPKGWRASRRAGLLPHVNEDLLDDLEFQDRGDDLQLAAKPAGRERQLMAGTAVGERLLIGTAHLNA